MTSSLKTSLAGLAATLMLAAGLGLAQAQDPSESGDLYVPEGYELTGESRQCLSARRVDSVTPLTEEAWLVRVGPGQAYLTRISGVCPAAMRSFTYLQYEVHGGQICRGEIVTVKDRDTHMFAGSCSFGRFEQMRRVETTGE